MSLSLETIVRPVVNDLPEFTVCNICVEWQTVLGRLPYVCLANPDQIGCQIGGRRA